MERQNCSDICVIYDSVYLAGISGRMVFGIDLGSQVVGLQSDEMEPARIYLPGKQSALWHRRSIACVCDRTPVLVPLSETACPDQGGRGHVIDIVFCGRCRLQCGRTPDRERDYVQVNMHKIRTSYLYFITTRKSALVLENYGTIG